jgi:hypothetical protein
MASTLSGSIDNTRIIPSGTQEQLPYHWVIFELKALVPGVALDQVHITEALAGHHRRVSLSVMNSQLTIGIHTEGAPLL